jgi:phenylacetate-CoA ligase
LALAGGEPFGDAVRQHISERWGIACFDIYGTAEAGIIAVECEQHHGLHLHPDVLYELLDPVSGARAAPGEPAELVLSVDTDELPLLRFGTGDIVRMETAACACGRRTPRLTVQGRVGDSVRVRGMLLHASQLRAFAQRADAAACRVTIRRQNGNDELVVMWRGKQSAEPPSPAVLDAAFRDACRLRADRFDEAPSLPDGEFALIDERGSQAGAAAGPRLPDRQKP